MTCEHVYILNLALEGDLTLVTCDCGHAWQEHPIAMKRSEYEMWMVLIDLHLPRSLDTVTRER